MGTSLVDTSPLPALSNGEHALALIQRQTRRLAALQREVLADGDPEPLHQFRVSLRRLRTALQQFAPALELPDGVGSGRIAALARRTGLCRDLDVLRQRLDSSLLPRLVSEERQALRPALKRLQRERRLAFEAVSETLVSPRYLKLLARLGRWQQRPAFTSLGHQPLAEWLHEWHLPLSGALYLDPGWQASDPRSEELHSLRKRIKGVRYALEHLVDLLDAPGQGWIAALKQAQGLLGDLHDLQVLEACLLDRPGQRPGGDLAGLRAELERQRVAVWGQWRPLAALLLLPESRRALPALRPLPQAIPPPPSGEGAATAGS
jgi:CHAD domain-containing protein